MPDDQAAAPPADSLEGLLKALALRVEELEKALASHAASALMQAGHDGQSAIRSWLDSHLHLILPIADPTPSAFGETSSSADPKP